jgi:hypothetical protein
MREREADPGRVEETYDELCSLLGWILKKARRRTAQASWKCAAVGRPREASTEKDAQKEREREREREGTGERERERSETYKCKERNRERERDRERKIKARQRDRERERSERERGTPADLSDLRGSCLAAATVHAFVALLLRACHALVAMIFDLQNSGHQMLVRLPLCE